MPLAEIHFDHDDESNHLSVTIETQRLFMRSVGDFDRDPYQQLLGKKENMSKFAADGKPYPIEQAQYCIDKWVTRWQNNDPFSSFSVVPNDSDDCIGMVILGYGNKEGSAQLAYVFDQKNWGKGYGKEAVIPVVKRYAPELIKRGYQIAEHEFTSIEATVRPDNPASVKILSAAGMKYIGESKKFGHTRYDFFIKTAELVQQQSVENIDDVPTSCTHSCP